MGLEQHSTPPSPGLMQSTSVPQVSHWNRLPNWLATVYLLRYCLSCMGWPQHERSPWPALVTIISVLHLVH
jgi:hypothetical protein